MSVYVLCDYGLSPAIAKKLYSLNITLEDILNEKYNLNYIFGEKSLKAKNIKRCVEILKNNQNKKLKNLFIYYLSLIYH